VIDVRDESMGAWFEAKIVKITAKSEYPSTSTDKRRTTVLETAATVLESASENVDVQKKETDVDVNENVKVSSEESAVCSKGLMEDDVDEVMYSILYDG